MPSGTASTTSKPRWRSIVRSTARPSYDSKMNLTYPISARGTIKKTGTTSCMSEAIARFEQHFIVLLELPDQRFDVSAHREIAHAEPHVVAWHVAHAWQREPAARLDRVDRPHLELDAILQDGLADQRGDARLGL